MPPARPPPRHRPVRRAPRLEREGVDSFMKSFDELISALESKAAELQS
jgi:hypothetical protein